jgi:hypothetical protein
MAAVANRSSELYAHHVPMRAEEQQEIIGALPARNVLVVGDRGAGKSVLLAQLAIAMHDRTGISGLMAPAVLDLATAPQHELFHSLMRAATQACHPLMVGARPRLLWSEGAVEYGEREFSADLGTLLAWIQPQLAQRLVLVFLLDNAEALDRYEGSSRDAFRRLIVAASGAVTGPSTGSVAAFAPAVRLVLASAETPGIVEGFAELFHTVHLAPLSPIIAAQFLCDGTRGMLEWEPQAEQLAVARAAGNPAQLISLGRAASHAAIANSRLRITVSDIAQT